MCRIISGLEHYLPFRLWSTIFSQGYGMKRAGFVRSSVKAIGWNLHPEVSVSLIPLTIV